MTLPTGTISIGQVSVEGGYSATRATSLNEGFVRTLAGKPSGAISMNDLRGKSAYDGTVDAGDLGGVYANDYFSGGASGTSPTTWTISGLSAGTVVTLRFTVSGVTITAAGQYGPNGASGNGSVGVERISGPSGYGSGGVPYNTNQAAVTKTFDITVQNGDVLRLYANGSATAYDFNEQASGSFSGSIDVTNLTVGQGSVAGGSWTLDYSSTGGLG